MSVAFKHSMQSSPDLIATPFETGDGREPGHDTSLDFRPRVEQLRQRLHGALLGKPEVIEFVLASLLAQGHVLLEDKPGLGKTTLAKALAQSISGRFGRVQCTPDLLPNDLTGFNIYNQKTQEFEFREGPVFTEILLTDEINRATPRTQSALLEAMAERQVTIDNFTYSLPPTFFVIATQNPHEQHGTYPLPEAQLDRFAVKLSIGYPQAGDEARMLAAASSGNPVAARQAMEGCLTPVELARLQQLVAAVTVQPGVQEYLVRVAGISRAHPRITLGLSPRALLIWQRLGQAWAWLKGRDFVTPSDLQDVARPVLAVRLAVDGDSADAIIGELIESVPVPTPHV